MAGDQTPTAELQVGDRVAVPGGRHGTIVGVKTVWVQLDDVGSRNYADVTQLTREAVG